MSFRKNKVYKILGSILVIALIVVIVIYQTNKAPTIIFQDVVYEKNQEVTIQQFASDATVTVTDDRTSASKLEYNVLKNNVKQSLNSDSPIYINTKDKTSDVYKISVRDGLGKEHEEIIKYTIK